MNERERLIAAFVLGLIGGGLAAQATAVLSGDITYSRREGDRIVHQRYVGGRAVNFQVHDDDLAARDCGLCQGHPPR